MTTGRTVETLRAWILEVVAVNGQVTFGNAPLVVNKATGAVVPIRRVWRKFASLLGVTHRIRRWRHRRRTY